jgi:DNA helicase II / ATP-dependent DNA helicase PcrA
VSKLFDGLNKAQQEAVRNIDGPALVIAGAGAGKTRVLTYRIAHLLENKVTPSSILALTFTNKAAREMKDRIGNLLGDDQSRYIWMGTFHSIFARILRKESDKLGYPSSFSIYDTTDTKSLIKSIVKELQLDDKIYKPGEIYNRISSAKNNLITPQAYLNNDKIRERDRITRKPMLGDIFKMYAARCKKAGAMDFDDLLLNTNILFRDFPETLKVYQEKFKYILVDEYQDTNYSQYLIVKKLGEKHQNVCVVGDDAQSIYSFRGAQIENILNFKNDYPSFKLFKLEQNYRSTRTIVDAANSIIDKNRDQIKKKVFSENEQGAKINVVRTLTDIEEGFMVSNSIFDTILSQQANYNDFAIMYRTNAQSRIFEEALRRRNIPYKVYGSISFYQRKEIKDMIAYLRLLINPGDDEALKRVINYPARGIGDTTLNKLEESAARNEISIWQVLVELPKESTVFNRGTLTKLEGFRNFILENQEKTADQDAYEISKNMAAISGIMKELRNGNTPEEVSKYENLEELLNGIRDFTEEAREEGQPAGLHNYLENIALLTDADNEKVEDRNKVSIMTIHSAKGLEFSHVYIAGVEEELFPSPQSVENLRDLEEERRLFYVAVTRAKKSVNISYSQSRYKWGVPADCQPSRFIKDIDDKYIEWPDDPRKIIQIQELSGQFGNDANPVRLKKESSDFKRMNSRLTSLSNAAIAGSSTNTLHNPNFIPSDPMSVQTGMMVEHQRFGLGKVVHVEGDMPNKKATVFFQQIKEEKQLLLKFAKLRIVEDL